MKKDFHAFLKKKRKTAKYRPVYERIKDYKDVVAPRSDEESQEQALRCMDCGTPFCHWGCPVANLIPEWNEFVSAGHWYEAFNLLDSTNVLPEVTGRICPALCESACVLGVTDEPVTVRENELAIIERAFKERYVKPRIPKKRSGKKIGVIGSGPAGISTAVHLNRLGHNVTVFEKDERIGGFLRFGIPDFKLEKNILDRRLDIFEKEGVEFKTNINIGKDLPVSDILKEFDIICITIGCRVPRDLKVPGRELKGIHFAADYLTQVNRINSGAILKEQEISASNKKVIIIGGGDTGSDCIGTANRQGAVSVKQIEIMPQMPEFRAEDMPWPYHPLLLRTSSSHKEGAERHWSVLTKEIIGENGHVKKLICDKVEFSQEKDSGDRPGIKKIQGTEFEIEADLVILAMGFTQPDGTGIIKELGLKVDDRGNIQTNDNYRTSNEKVFSAGDARRGASLIVWALYEGYMAAKNIDIQLNSKKEE
ncbi:glutamate synthase subunit beta [bacterium]